MPNKLVKTISALLRVLGLFVVAIVSAAIIYRSYQQHRNTDAFAIHSRNGIDERRFVLIGGLEQWITIRGEDSRLPVILFLHGGPGGASSAFFTQFAEWEKSFTVVQWDQRGAGRTYGKSGAIGDDISIDRMVQDGVEVAQFVRTRLHQDKIILVGHSWGSLLGMRMAKARPDLFHAYVGTGQIVDYSRSESLAYAQVFAKARGKHDNKAMQDLAKIGPPPYDNQQKFAMLSGWANSYESGTSSASKLLAGPLFAPDYSVMDVWGLMAGQMSSADHFFGKQMQGPLTQEDLSKLGSDFVLPLFFFQGAEDDVMPSSLAQAYMKSLNAPYKEFVLIPNAGHSAITTKPELFLKLLVEKVRPFAIASIAAGL